MYKMNVSFAFLLALIAACADIGLPLTIVSRSQWGGRAAKGGQVNIRAPARVFVHHTVTPSCSTDNACASQVKSIQNYHMDNQGWRDIGYSFLIGGNGKVYEGRGWNAAGAHTINYNNNAYGVSFIGNFEIEQPSTVMLKAFNELMEFAVSKAYLSGSYKVNGHRDVYSTACPGKNLYSIIRTWPRYDKNIKKTG